MADGELPGEADRLDGQAAAARVAGGVHEVQHAQDHREVARLVQAAAA